MLQRLVHDLIHPQVTTLKVQYLEFIQKYPHSYHVDDVMAIEDDVHALRTRQHGSTFQRPPPGRLDKFRLVQYADAYTTIRYAYIGLSYGIHPARIAFLAYSAPGQKLSKQSFWSVNEQRRLGALVIDGLGYMRNGQYCEGIQPSKELKDIVDRRRVDAITSSANYAFACGTPDCEKCAEVER
jgi:hypothetical protein